jgi:hypothetical protein
VVLIRKDLKPDPCKNAFEELRDRMAVLDGQSNPDDHHPALELTQQVPQKGYHIQRLTRLTNLGRYQRPTPAEWGGTQYLRNACHVAGQR